MGKNINPKSLKGKDKVDRIKNLMGRMNTLNESTSLSELELVKKGPNGVIYGVVRENHKYFIKTTEKKSGNVVAEDFNYIGGLQNKFDEAYNSYAEVTKQLNLKFDMLNESFGIEENNNIFENDGVAFDRGTGFGFSMDKENEEEEVVDEQEYKLKVDAPQPSVDPVEPSMEAPVEDEVDMGGEEDFAEEPAMDNMGGEEDLDGEDESDPTKKIQKMTGKIGQMMRDMEEVDTDLEKYVINSVISAMHLDQFSDEDIEDVITKLEGEDEEDDMGAEDGGGELPLEEPSMEGEPEMEEEPIDEPEMAEESYKIKKGDLVESLTKKIVKKKLSEDFGGYGRMKPSSPKRRSAARNWRYNKRNEQENIFVDEDFEMGMDTKMEMRRDDFDMEMSSDYIDCSDCDGMGCPHCDGQGYHMSNEFDGDDIADDFMTIDGETGEYGPFDRDGDDIASSVDQDDDGDGFLDEMEGDGYGMDVLNSISGSIDIDGDGISSKVDNSMYGDGESNGLDIEFFNDPMTKPRTRPGIGDPTTTPGKKERKGPWTKPDKKGKPKAIDGDAPIERRSFRKKGFFR
jgi:hypothetical protein